MSEIKATARPPMRGNVVIMAIGGFKLFGAILLALAGFGIFRLMGKDLGESFQHLVEHLHIDPESRIVQFAGTQVAGITPGRLRALGAGSFFYAALESAEGIGLLMRKRWAEYLTILATASLLPLELFEIARKVSAVRLLILAINVAVLVYLVVRVVRTRREAGAGPG